MNPIQSVDDVSIFAGRIVAYKTTSYRLGSTRGYDIGVKDVRFALIDKEIRTVTYNNLMVETGYLMSLFLGSKEIPSDRRLSDSSLEKANMHMRLASIDEIERLKTAMQHNEANLEYGYRFDEVATANLLNDAIERLKEQEHSIVQGNTL